MAAILVLTYFLPDNCGPNSLNYNNWQQLEIHSFFVIISLLKRYYINSQEYHSISYLFFSRKIGFFQWPLANLSTINASIHLYVRKRVQIQDADQIHKICTSTQDINMYTCKQMNTHVVSSYLCLYLA